MKLTAQTQEQAEGKNYSSANSKSYGRGKNPASQANLKPFPKGVSGNPSGRPQKNARFIEALKEYGKKKYVNLWGEKQNNSWNKVIIEQIWNDASSGNYKAIRLLIEMGALEPEPTE